MKIIPKGKPELLSSKFGARGRNLWWCHGNNEPMVAYFRDEKGEPTTDEYCLWCKCEIDREPNPGPTNTFNMHTFIGRVLKPDDYGL